MPSLLLDNNFTRTPYTLEDAVDTVLGDLGYRDNNFITSGDVVAWLNRGQTILAREAQGFRAVVTLDTVSGQAEYAIPFDATTRPVAIQSVRWDTTPLPYVSESQLFALDPMWETHTPGNPRYHYLRGINCIGLYPAPNETDSDAIQVKIIGLPPQVSEPEDNFYCPYGCEDALITYAKLCACVKDRVGEGKDMIPYFASEWKMCIQCARDLVKNFADKDTVRWGEVALYPDYFYEIGFIRADQLAVPLTP